VGFRASRTHEQLVDRTRLESKRRVYPKLGISSRRELCAALAFHVS
jgi:hypothetical protein